MSLILFVASSKYGHGSFWIIISLSSFLMRCRQIMFFRRVMLMVVYILLFGSFNR